MREAGLNVDAQAMDWGSVVSRRAKKEPPAQGGWNIFVTTSGTVGGSNPILHTWIGAACDKGLFGWPCDAEVEKLRSAYGFAHTDEEKMKVARDLQRRAIEQSRRFTWAYMAYARAASVRIVLSSVAFAVAGKNDARAAFSATATSSCGVRSSAVAIAR